MDQRGGLQRMTRRFVRHFLRGDFSQLMINERK